MRYHIGASGFVADAVTTRRALCPYGAARGAWNWQFRHAPPTAAGSWKLEAGSCAEKSLTSGFGPARVGDNICLCVCVFSYSATSSPACWPPDRRRARCRVAAEPQTDSESELGHRRSQCRSTSVCIRVPVPGARCILLATYIIHATFLTLKAIY